MYPFPASFPAEEARLVVTILRNGEYTLAEANQAVWSIYGYTSGQISSVDTIRPFSTEKITNEMAAAHLEQAITNASTTDPSLKAGIPWGTLIPILLDLLQRFWSRK